MRHGCLAPGGSLNLRSISQSLGLSITPLRDALIQLESEGFVAIQPRRGIYIVELTLNDFRNLYEFIGVLENTAINSIKGKIDRDVIEKLRECNNCLERSIEKQDLDGIYHENIYFHNLYLDLCENPFLLKTLRTLRMRLFDFPRMTSIPRDWWESSLQEHAQFIGLLEQGQICQAADYMREVHFSYQYQEHYISKYHFPAGSTTHPIF